MPQHGFEDCCLAAHLIGRSSSHANALSVDHFAHDAAGAVCRADQHLRLVEVQMNKRTGVVHLRAVIFCRLPNSALLPASVPVRNTPSQPRMAAKNGYSQPVCAKATPSVASNPA